MKCKQLNLFSSTKQSKEMHLKNKNMKLLFFSLNLCTKWKSSVLVKNYQYFPDTDDKQNNIKSYEV